MTGQAVGLAVVVFALQAVMPQGSKPSDLIGSFHGNTRTAELDAERTAQVRTAGSMANAQAAAPANWQMEQQLSQTQQQAVAGSLEAQSTMANMADVACIGGGILGSFFGSNRDAADIAKGLQSTCGAGDAIRKNITNTLADAARNGSGVMQRSAPDAVQAAGAQAGRPVPAGASQR